MSVGIPRIGRMMRPCKEVLKTRMQGAGSWYSFRMRILPAVLVFACALAVSLGAAGSAGASTGVQYGIQDDAWLEFGPGKLHKRIAKLDRIGFDAVRVTLDWSKTEIRRNRYRWKRSDRLLRAIHARGLRPIVTIWGTPLWANGRNLPNVAPTNGADFQRFTATASKRYPYVDAWVMWNEPNKAAWLKPASAKTYVSKILNPGYRGIKSVNRGDRVAGGVTGPTAGRGGIAPVDFIRFMKPMKPLLDAYAHHPYPVFPGDTPYKGGCFCKTITMASLDRLLNLVNRNFPKARVWITEYAYQTNPPDRFGVSQAHQARYIGESARRVYEARKVDLLIHYLYRDEPSLARWQSGLVTVRERPKLGLAAMRLPLAQVKRQGSQTTLWGQVRPGDGAQRYSLQRKLRGTWVTLGGPQMTDRRGFIRRTVSAGKGQQIRLWYFEQRVASPPLTVR
jgi:hypothetical protein